MSSARDSEASKGPRRRRQGAGRRRGAGGRQDVRWGKTGPAAPSHLTRTIPPYELLSEEGLAQVEAHSDRILEEVGMEVWGDPETLRLFKEAGADVKGERIHFPKGLVASIIKERAPGSFVQHARNPDRSVTIGGNNTVFVPAYGSPFVRDLDKGRRYGALEDFENLVKLAYAIPWLHHSGGTICEPVDVPVNKRHLDMVYAHMRWSDKCYMGSVTAPERAADSIQMSRLLFGEDFVDNHCVILGNINVNSPLVYDGQVTKVIRTYAAANQGIVICPFILGGAMGPVTPAGAVAQAHAEAMVGVAIAQLERAGAPAIYGNFLSTMSLRSGAPTFGMPESALAYLVVGQLARRLGVPFRCGGSFTSSKIPDAQSAQESADSLLPALMGGANFVLHAAGWLEGGLTMGYEKLILDADRLGMMHKFTQGFALDDNAFAMDAFLEVGPGKHFLGSGHTLSNYETAYYEPTTSDSNSFEQWHEEGEKSADRRAYEQWTRLLDEYEPPPMDEAVNESLVEFITKKKASMPDALY